MSRLKICGITDAAFALEAAKRGVDYLGFVFAESSPRHVTPQKTKAIISAVRDMDGKLASSPLAVGVFTTQSVDEILKTAAFAALDIVQLHDSFTDADVAAVKAKGYEVWRLNGEADATLLDGRTGDKSGKADWSKVETLKAAGRRVVLAGCISADNIAAAVATGADVIDVSSSLETSPGVKSLQKLHHLMSVFDNSTRNDL